MKRGEVWMVDFGVPSGLEQAGIRPAIALQDIVVPLSSKKKRLVIPRRFSSPLVKRA